MVDKIKLSDIIGKFSNNINQIANWVNKDENEYLEGEEISAFFRKVEEKKNNLNADVYSQVMGLELSARGKKISELPQDEQDMAANYDKDSDGYLDTQENTTFEADKEKKLIASGILSERKDNELETKVRTISPFNGTEGSTKSANNQEVINFVYKVLIEGNKQVPKVKVTDATTAVTKELAKTEYQNIIEISNGKIKFKHSNITIDTSKIKDLDQDFSLKDLTTVVDALEKTIRQDLIDSHTNRINVLKDSIKDTQEKFLGSLEGTETYNSIVEYMKKEGKEVKDLPKSSQIVYYKHKFNEAIANKNIFEWDTDKQEYKLNLDENAKQYYDQLNKIASELDLKGKVKALLDNMTEKHLKEIELAGFEALKTKYEPIYNQLKQYKESMERGINRIAATEKADKDDLKNEKDKLKENSTSTGKTNRQYSGFASDANVAKQQGLTQPIETREAEYSARTSALSEHDLLVEENKELKKIFLHKKSETTYTQQTNTQQSQQTQNN